MAWITPKTDWVSTDYYNFSDLNRVENNINELVTLINSFSSISSPTSITSRTNASLDYYDSLNRIENNILALATATYVPPSWVTPYVTWVSVYKSFAYIDANRLETNLLALKTMLDQIIAGFIYCGDSLTSVCGKGNTTF